MCAIHSRNTFELRHEPPWYQVRGMMLHLHTSTRPINLSGSLHVRYIQLLYNYELKRYVSRNRLVLYYCKLIIHDIILIHISLAGHNVCIKQRTFHKINLNKVVACKCVIILSCVTISKHCCTIIFNLIFCRYLYVSNCYIEKCHTKLYTCFMHVGVFPVCCSVCYLTFSDNV